MRFLSLFSGIGGFDLGFQRAGMECVGQVEIDKDACRVLARWWPNVQQLGDITRLRGHPAVDLVCGGFPCQDLSVAGKRAGLAGERSGLWYEFRRVLAELNPEWVVIENVGGLLSSQSGRDMAVVLRGLAELGYWWAYRVFDAQYFGVAQRRERVFIVGHSRERTHPAKVLLESESCGGDSPPRRSPREGVAASLTSGSHPSSNAAGRHREDDVNLTVGALTASQDNGSTGNSQVESGQIIVAPFVRATRPHGPLDGPLGDERWEEAIIHPTLSPHSATQNAAVTHTLSAEGSDASEDGTGRGTPLVASVAVRGRADGQEWELGEEGLGNALRAGNGGSSRANWALTGATVRRLTPTECERLQGFPDGWTDQLSDSARYRVLGNAVCVPVAEWIGRRING